MISLGHDILPLVRRRSDSGIFVDNIETFDWDGVLNGVDCVVHCAGRAHIIEEMTYNSMQKFDLVNVIATERLLSAAIQQNVKRFIFLSSIGVLGIRNYNGRPFSENDVENPQDLYSASKLEAERRIKSLCHNELLKYVIIRPPLVYGPGARGNFRSLVRYVRSRLPFFSFAPKNRRSFVAINNLVNFISMCADSESSPNADNQTFLVSDDEVVSTSELLYLLANSFGVKHRFPSVPFPLICFFGKFIGKFKKFERIFDNLEVDNSKAQYLLGWKPIISMKKQLDLISNYDTHL
jgi:nucleoside-diphosphate-sugar epimerase